ncbi:MAG: twin-arginine translocase subunit TatB [Clostridia bacterium]|nr:twin-arginine translocase subunit TatB [Clostridia bacterium]MBR4459273.1 twin-arginine translocase subunit TatB [Clostridia bacterium]
MNIGFAELLLILIVAYVIVGPKDLPKVARWLARLVKKARQLLREVREEVGWDEMMSETEDVRKDIDTTLKDADVTKDLREAQQSLRKNLRQAEKDTMKK